MFRISTVAIDPTTLRNDDDNPHAGAVSIFEGLVRNHHEGRRVLRLEYEAHRAVAEKEGRRILEEATEKFGLDYAGAVHRTGSLEIGACAVMVVVSAPHRAETFAACRFVIDEVKRRLPIWKKEFYTDGSSKWVGCAGCRGTHQH